MGLVPGIKAIGEKPVGSMNEEEKWIQKAIKKPGALKQQLGVPAGEKIPAGKLAAAAEKGGKLGQRARLAQTLKKLKETAELSEEQVAKVDALVAELENEELTAKQKQLDVDKDGEIEGSDLAALRAKKEEVVAEGEDHEVSMANNALDDIIKNATELKAKMGEGEKEIPAWIQDHVSQAQNFISQANTNYHEYGQEEKPVAPDAGAM
jgi:chromosome segregation ATPase